MLSGIYELSLGPLIAAGVIVLVLGYILVDKVFAWSTDSFKVEDDPMFDIPGAGRWIGALESIVFLLAILVSFPEAIGGWLLFKVAAKWDTWAHVVQLPKPNDSPEEVANRIRFGTWLHSKFIIGTLLNILLAAVGAWSYMAIKDFLSTI